MLTVDTAVAYLLERGLVEPDWILSGDLTLRSAVRRNRNLRIEGPDGAGYLIKQPDELAPAGRKSLACEATFYQFCQSEPIAACLVPLMPRLVLRDTDRALHVLELIPNAATLAAYHLRHAPEEFPLEASRHLGHGLATLHKVFRSHELAGDPGFHWLSRWIPWVFEAHRKPTPAMLKDLSPAGAHFFKIIRNEHGLGERLESLASMWRYETLIHSDVKSDNVLVGVPGAGPNFQEGRVWLVDWEFVQIGDPAWDLGSALHDYLVFWTSSMPLDPELDVGTMIDQARYPLSVLRPAIGALWEGYRAATGLNDAGNETAADALLRRAVAFSGVRLLLAAHECSLEQEKLPAQTVLLLQLGVNLLADPDSGQIQLYGLSRELGLQ